MISFILCPEKKIKSASKTMPKATLKKKGEEGKFADSDIQKMPEEGQH